VLKLRRQWDDNFHRSRAVIEQGAPQLVSAQEDQLVMRWSSNRVSEADRKLTEAEERLMDGNWREVITCVSTTKDLIKKAVDDAQTQEAQEARAALHSEIDG